MNVQEIKDRISELPSGGITLKRMKNKSSGTVYEYQVYQWRENGKQKSRYLHADEVETLSSLIEERKMLEDKLASLEKRTVSAKKNFFTEVKTEESLRNTIQGVIGLKKREIIGQLEEYVFGEQQEKVFVLYGLRRTGKTTMMRQVIAEMGDEQFAKAAYVQISPSNDFGQLNQDILKLEENGYKYIFIDEVTLLDDFIESAAILSDIYVASGIKIVLSGTDSLGFWISKSNQLYDRCLFLHTTFIPYREFENVLGVRGIDEYIQFGGTMSMSGKHYNAFSEKAATDEYIDSAIAHNIQHSLKCYQDEGHFRHLYSLYEQGELTSAINRVVEDINHRFTVNVLTREFKSGDLAISARNLRHENNVLDLIDREAVTARLKDLLEIKNKSEQTVKIDRVHEAEIKEYLAALDLIRDIQIADIDLYGQGEQRTAFIQAGLRYSQAKSLVEVLMKDRVFSSFSFNDRKYISERILSEIKGRMLEDIVLIETAMATPDREVFKLQFADGEYDMVVFDSENGGCRIYEIKYSTIIEPNQYRHLADEEKSNKTAFRYGGITGKYVLYRGKTQNVDGIEYINVEEYLKAL